MAARSLPLTGSAARRSRAGGVRRAVAARYPSTSTTPSVPCTAASSRHSGTRAMAGRSNGGGVASLMAVAFRVRRSTSSRHRFARRSHPPRATASLPQIHARCMIRGRPGHRQWSMVPKGWGGATARAGSTGHVASPDHHRLPATAKLAARRPATRTAASRRFPS